MADNGSAWQREGNIKINISPDVQPFGVSVTNSAVVCAGHFAPPERMNHFPISRVTVVRTSHYKLTSRRHCELHQFSLAHDCRVSSGINSLDQVFGAASLRIAAIRGAMIHFIPLRASPGGEPHVRYRDGGARTRTVGSPTRSCYSATTPLSSACFACRYLLERGAALRMSLTYPPPASSPLTGAASWKRCTCVWQIRWPEPEPA